MKKKYKIALYILGIILTLYASLVIYIVSYNSSERGYDDYYFCSRVSTCDIIAPQIAYSIYLKIFI
mgnify:CR=1 FL=1